MDVSSPQGIHVLDSASVRWRVRERALLDLAAAIIDRVHKMANDRVSMKDCRCAIRLVRALPYCGSPSGAKRARSAWQAMPAYLQDEIAKMATAAECAGEMQRAIGDGWPCR